jgi:hypothetical protein
MKVNIKNLIETQGLDRKRIAAVLFPNNVRPDMALNRLEKGWGDLNSEQLANLAAEIGCSVQELYRNPLAWTCRRLPNTVTGEKENVFTLDGYRAHLSENLDAVTISHVERLLWVVLPVTPDTTINQFFEILNKQIQ